MLSIVLLLPTAFLQKRHNVLLGEAKLAHAGQKFRDAFSCDLLSYLTNHFSVLRYIASARAVGEHQALALHFRKRTLREKMELVQSGSAECVKNFLPLMDDLQRALEAIEKSNDLEALREGVKLIAQKFRETLKKQNVKEIEALGLELDTDHHEAVARFDAGKEKKGKIVDVVQPGYKMGDKVLRFAKVVVGE